MKMHQKIILLIALVALVAACGRELKYIAPLDPVSVLTGVANTDSLNISGKITVTGELASAGDGIVEHGHVWSTVNEFPDYDTDNKSKLGSLDEPANFTSSVILSEANVTYFIRAYVIDIYDRITA